MCVCVCVCTTNNNNFFQSFTCLSLTHLTLSLSPIFLHLLGRIYFFLHYHFTPYKPTHTAFYYFFHKQTLLSSLICLPLPFTFFHTFTCLVASFAHTHPRTAFIIFHNQTLRVSETLSPLTPLVCETHLRTPPLFLGNAQEAAWPDC